DDVAELLAAQVVMREQQNRFEITLRESRPEGLEQWPLILVRRRLVELDAEIDVPVAECVRRGFLCVERRTAVEEARVRACAIALLPEREDLADDRFRLAAVARDGFGVQEERQQAQLVGRLLDEPVLVGRGLRALRRALIRGL